MKIEHPDLILVNGKIITVDNNDRIVEALAIRNGKILALGNSEEIKALSGEGTRRIDLKGNTVTPGLLDAHMHLSASPFTIPNMIDVRYPNVKSIDDIKSLISAQIKKVSPGEWIQGKGLDEGKIKEKRLITAKELDEISPNNPVWLSHTTGHYGVANTKALEIAEIDATTPNPPEGIIERDASGTATGTLIESAMTLIYQKLPPLTVEDIEKGIAHMSDLLNSEGMTGAKDPTLTDERWEAYKNLLDSKKLKVRVLGLWHGGKSEESVQSALRQHQEIQDTFKIGKNDHLVSGGIKIFADGSGGARTAWLYDEWNKNFTEVDKGNYGFPNMTPDVLREMIKTIHEAGVHVSIHAIGDRTIDTVASIYKEVLETKPTQGLRHGIIHANIPTPTAMTIMKELQSKYDAGYPEPSATFTWWIGDTYARNFGERAKRLNPFATFKEKGIIWANGSDYAVTPFPARYGIWSSIARQPEVGKYEQTPFGLEEAVDVKTALKASTIWAAHQMFMEEHIGSIEVGKYADLAIWDRDLYTVSTPEIKNMKCLMTLFNGDIVYTADELK
ncbi:MAG: amidohydrolase [Chthoniobacterales bacterium]